MVSILLFADSSSCASSASSPSRPSYHIVRLQESFPCYSKREEHIAICLKAACVLVRKKPNLTYQCSRMENKAKNAELHLKMLCFVSTNVRYVLCLWNPKRIFWRIPTSIQTNHYAGAGSSRDGSVSLRTPSKAALLVTLTSNTLPLTVNSTGGKADLSLFHRYIRQNNISFTFGIYLQNLENSEHLEVTEIVPLLQSSSQILNI